MWIVKDPERDLEKDPHPLLEIKLKESLIWKREMRTMPVEHSKFIWDIVSYISNLQAFFDFAIGCGIPSHIVQRAIEDNDPSDDDITLEGCVVQAWTVWWLSYNRQAWIPNHQYPPSKMAHNQVQVDRCPQDQLNI